jgi:hypothetical protein
VPKGDGELLFQNLIPMTAHLHQSEYSDRVDKLVEEQLELLQDRVEATKGSLVSMNLPAALDALEAGASGLSVTMATKVNALVSKGGLGALREKRAELERLQVSNADLMRDCREKIEQEEMDDNSMRSHYGPRWPRETSQKLTAAMVGELDKYEQQLSTAGSSDGAILGKLLEHESVIAELSEGISVVEASLPGANVTELSPVAVAAATELRGYMGQLNELLTARDPMQQKMKTVRRPLNPLTRAPSLRTEPR